MSLSHGVGSELDGLFVRCFEEVEDEEDLSTVVRHFFVQALSKLSLSLVLLRPPFGHLYLAKHFNY